MRAAPTVTVGEIVQFLAPAIEEPNWPPDVFAVAGLLLRMSGAYVETLERGHLPPEWIQKVRKVGQEWRAAAVAPKGRAPAAVRAGWKKVLDNGETPLNRVAEDPRLCRCVLLLFAAADEACHGVGVVGSKVQDAFDSAAASLLVAEGTLCRKIDRNRVVVLPKLHTPRSGLTLRSMSLHLSLFTPSGVEAKWLYTPTELQSEQLQILLVPWPRVIEPAQFRPVKKPALDVPGDYGCFCYSPPRMPPSYVADVQQMMVRARQATGSPVDLVVFPELALTRGQYAAMERAVCARYGATLVAGTIDLNKQPTVNSWSMSFPRSTPIASLPFQSKHHRWLLDAGQITQYGLETQLDPKRLWWEHARIGRRSVAFMSMRPWLTLSVLICEDLARQDPVAEVLRTVGPNLVIALLLDGPQLKSRWSARYGTVLADDPGSSVLTLTSVGMAQLARADGCAPSRVIALWRDALGGEAREIDLPPGADAMVLTLGVDRRVEWTADGRSDGGAAAFPRLLDVKPVSVVAPVAPASVGLGAGEEDASLAR